MAFIAILRKVYWLLAQLYKRSKVSGGGLLPLLKLLVS